MGILLEINPFKSRLKKLKHKLFGCPTFYKSIWNTFWKSKPYYRCPQCKKALHCYWDGNDTNKGTDYCNECASTH